MKMQLGIHIENILTLTHTQKSQKKKKKNSKKITVINTQMMNRCR